MKFTKTFKIYSILMLVALCAISLAAYIHLDKIYKKQQLFLKWARFCAIQTEIWAAFVDDRKIDPEFLPADNSYVADPKIQDELVQKTKRNSVVLRQYYAGMEKKFLEASNWPWKRVIFDPPSDDMSDRQRDRIKNFDISTPPPNMDDSGFVY